MLKEKLFRLVNR